MEPLTIIHPIHDQDHYLVPFMHALGLADAFKGELEIVDVRGKHAQSEISIRKVFERWGKLPLHSQRGEVANILGFHVKKIVKSGSSKKEIGNRLRRHPHDILVLGVTDQSGLHRWFGPHLVEYLVDYFRQTTLYVPIGTKPFVNKEDGNATIKKVIVPVAEIPSPEPSFQLLNRILDAIGGDTPEVVGLHVGDEFPLVSAPSLEGLNWKEVCMHGAVAKHIVSCAKEEDADCIVMTTNGRDTFKQKIMGSITEQVVHHAPCPVLAVAVH